MNPELNGFYVGVVIQNDDPERRNRCKIFIPGVNSSLVSELIKNEDVKIDYDEQDGTTQLNTILPRLKQTLPWAEYAGPIFGGDTRGVYDAKAGNATMVERPSKHQRPTQITMDAFSTNPLQSVYSIADYSGTRAGHFSIPNVGANVWCFFYQGRVNYPVYFAATYSQQDVESAYAAATAIDPSIALVVYPSNGGENA